jgi:hypothetical protein
MRSAKPGMRGRKFGNAAVTMAAGEGKSERERRLAEALRANLRRRKAQAKSRRAGDADGRAGLPAAAGDGADGAAPEKPASDAEWTDGGERQGRP